MDISTHDKLFTSSAEFYHNRGATLPASVQSLDVNTAIQGLEAVAKLKPTPRPGRQFRSPLAKHSKVAKSRSPSPTLGKVEQEDTNALKRLRRQFDHHYSQVFDSTFASLGTDLQCARLDDATKFILKGLLDIEQLDTKARLRKTKSVYRRGGSGLEDSSGTEQVSKEDREQLRERMRTLHAQICVIYAPLIANHPLEVDAGSCSFSQVRPLLIKYQSAFFAQNSLGCTQSTKFSFSSVSYAI